MHGQFSFISDIVGITKIVPLCIAVNSELKNLRVSNFFLGGGGHFSFIQIHEIGCFFQEIKYMYVCVWHNIGYVSLKIPSANPGKKFIISQAFYIELRQEWFIVIYIYYPKLCTWLVCAWNEPRVIEFFGLQKPSPIQQKL